MARRLLRTKAVFEPIVANRIHGSKSQRNLSANTTIFIEWKWFENGVYKMTSISIRPPLKLTCQINFDPINFHITYPFPNVKVGEWIMIHHTHYNGCNYFSMLGLKLNHVSKRVPGWSSFPIAASVTSSTLGQIYHCPSASEVTLMMIRIETAITTNQTTTTTCSYFMTIL